MIRRLAGSPLLRLFSSAVIDQAVLSAANFAVGLLLIRYSPEEQYGYYVLAFSTIQLLFAAQGAWMTGPLAVLAPKKSETRRREMVGALDGSQRRFLRLVVFGCMPLLLAGHALGMWGLHTTLIMAATVVAGWMMLRREYVRAVLMIYSRPGSVLRIDLFYVLFLVPLAAAAAVWSPAAGIFAVLGLGFAAAFGAFAGRRALAAATQWPQAPAAPVWAEIRPLGKWAASAAVIYWVYSQSYNFMLASRLDLAAVGNVNAVRLMLMPMILLAVGVGALLVPKAAAWLHADGLPRLMRRLWIFLLGMLVLDVLYVLALWVFKDWVALQVMSRALPDLALLVLLWALNMTLSMTRDVFQAGLLALERFRPMAWITALAAVCSLSGMWPLIDRFGAPGAVMGAIVGELVSLGGVILLLLQSLRADRARSRAEDAA